jgi:UDP-3-O-[3-hydroxymyristoyl] glucosamine N-acyltransferase
VTESAYYTLADLATRLEVSLNPAAEAASDTRIYGLATLASAGAGQLSFVSNPRYVSQLSSSEGTAFIVPASLGQAESRPCLLSDNPYVTYARASQLFAALREGGALSVSVEQGESATQAGSATNTGTQAATDEQAAARQQTVIHPSAFVAEGVSLGAGVRLGPNVVIEAGVSIGAGTIIHAGAVIGRKACIGRECLIQPNVTLYHEVILGDRVLLHAGVVIGADGFGFAFDGSKSVKIAQLGRVVIGDDVEIGAGSTVDRGALDDTTIGNGVKIDNQVQIGHNCVVGDHTVICGCTALAGSTRIGRYCVIGGAVGITGHLSICDKVQVSAMSMVTQSITEPGVYSSGTLLQETRQWKKNVLTLNKLSGLSRTVRNLEKRLPDGEPPESGNKL